MKISDLKEGQQIHLRDGRTIIVLEINHNSLVVTNKKATYIETWYFERSSNIYEENGEYFLDV